MENKAFQNRIKKILGGINMLQAIGFKEDKGNLVLASVNTKILTRWCDLIKEQLKESLQI